MLCYFVLFISFKFKQFFLVFFLSLVHFFKIQTIFPCCFSFSSNLKISSTSPSMCLSFFEYAYNILYFLLNYYASSVFVKQNLSKSLFNMKKYCPKQIIGIANGIILAKGLFGRKV